MKVLFHKKNTKLKTKSWKKSKMKNTNKKRQTLKTKTRNWKTQKLQNSQIKKTKTENLNTLMTLSLTTFKS